MSLRDEVYAWRYVLIGLAGLQAGDLVTTWAIISQGGSELNPFFSWVLGTDLFFPLMILSKTGFMVWFLVLLILSWRVSHPISRFSASSGLAVYGAVIGNNFLQLTAPGFCPV